MKTCPSCNKSNLPTRKYCIRCGSSLITAPKKRAVVDDTPEPALAETSQPTPGEVLARQAVESASPTTSTQDQWVKPSEVSKDRVRSASGAKRKTELEKAREAFARAETVGIDESGTGVVETRMLRASEVRELLEGSAEFEPSSPDVPPPMMMEGSEPLPPEAAEFMQPSVPKPKDIEEQILGTKSAFVQPTETSAPVSPFGTPVSSEFSSSRYEAEGTGEEPPIPVHQPAPVPEASEPETPTIETPAPASPAETSMLDEVDYVTICHNCGEATNIDQFEYPSEVYSAMGSARLKQARFLVVQGQADQANEILRVARSLFLKAGDENGLNETKRLIDSLARGI